MLSRPSAVRQIRIMTVFPRRLGLIYDDPNITFIIHGIRLLRRFVYPYDDGVRQRILINRRRLLFGFQLARGVQSVKGSLNFPLSRTVKNQLLSKGNYYNILYDYDYYYYYLRRTVCRQTHARFTFYQYVTRACVHGEITANGL